MVGGAKARLESVMDRQNVASAGSHVDRQDHETAQKITEPDVHLPPGSSVRDTTKSCSLQRPLLKGTLLR